MDSGHTATSAGKTCGNYDYSGGPATAIAYTCDLAGLEVPRFSESLQKEIKQYIEPHASAANPVDMTFHLSYEETCRNPAGDYDESGEVDAIVLHGIMHSGFMQEITIMLLILSEELASKNF